MSEPSAKHTKQLEHTHYFSDLFLELFILSFPRDGWGILMLVSERMHYLVTGVARRKGLNGVLSIKKKYANLSEELHYFVYNKRVCTMDRRLESYGLLRMMKNDIMDHFTTVYAASNGYFECLKYAHEYERYYGRPWNNETTEEAALRGHLYCLRYVHENGCEWGRWTTAGAASGGHLDCLKYAHENGCPWDGRTPSEAAIGGHLDCLKYAHENGCVWDENTPVNAAMCGHLDCLEYARENGCRWNIRTTAASVRLNCWGCLRYALENGCPYSEHTKKLAIEKGFVWPEFE